MDPTLRQAIERALADAGRPATIADSTPVGGGCINRAEIAFLEVDGEPAGRLFVKSNTGARAADMFEREAEGLRALAEPGVIRVPADPLPGRTRTGHTAFLVMEAVPTGRPRQAEPGFFEDFGRRFARLHRETAGATGGAGPAGAGRFGFGRDNYIGSTPQPNGWMDDWVEFFRERRLGFQIGLARERGLSDDVLDRLVDRLLDRLDERIDLPDEPACLLHGDLWSGNYMSDDAGRPVLVDPAVYYGHREADLAMTELFGGFDHTFYAAYEAEWPLPPGSPDRRELYKLYHLLNHLNLFGGGYRARCIEIAKRFAG
jgi:fructosamine-3-kinase